MYNSKHLINKKNIILTVALIFLTLYLREEMISDSLREMGNYNGRQILWMTAMFVTMATYIFFYIKVTTSLLNRASKTFLQFVILTFMVSMSWSFGNESLSLFGHLYNIILWLAPALAFYFVYMNNLSSDSGNIIPLISTVSILVLTYTFFKYYEYRLIYSMFTAEDQAYNCSYYMLYLLPLVLCHQRYWLRLLFFVIVTVAIVISGKRGGFLALVAGFFCYLCTKILVWNASKSKKWKSIIALGFAIGVIAWYSVDLFTNGNILIFNRLQEIEETGGSARDRVWQHTIEMISRSDIFSVIFGHGYNTVVVNHPMRLSAHNDFLEALYDYGLLLFIVYCLLHIQIIRTCIVMIRKKSLYAAPLAFSYAVFFVNSNVSHIILYPHYFVSYALVWGTILGLHWREQQEKVVFYENRNINVSRSL